MILSEAGESRINGYLFVLERSLKTFLPPDVVRDAVREIESHVRERLAASDGLPDERAALEKILAELGPPLRVAQAYSVERTIDEAILTGHLVPMFRAVWRLAVTTMVGFGAALGIFAGFVISFAFLAIAVMKPLFPDNVGLWAYNESGIPHDFGMRFPAPLDEHVILGYWVIPISVFAGLLLLVLNYHGVRRFLIWWRNRRLS
jgi:hypothetical protein